MGRAGDEFGRGHAQKGQRQIGLGGEGTPGTNQNSAPTPQVAPAMAETKV